MQVRSGIASSPYSDQFGDSDPFGEKASAYCDVIIFDDRPAEVKWFEDIVGVLGFKSKVLDRLSLIGDYLKDLSTGSVSPPRIVVVDLSWDFKNETYELLDREDLKVPKAEHLRGLVMLSEVLTKRQELCGVPAIMLSSFLSDYDDEYQAALREMREREIRVASIAKNHLHDAGGLERVARILRSLAVELSRVGGESEVDLDSSTIPEGAIDRALGVLAETLQVDTYQLKADWDFAARDIDLSDKDVFEFVRLAFKVSLAIKTVFHGPSRQHVLDDFGGIVPGVVVRDALAKGHFRSLTLLAAALEQRVGGPL